MSCSFSSVACGRLLFLGIVLFAESNGEIVGFVSSVLLSCARLLRGSLSLHCRQHSKYHLVKRTRGGH